MVGFILLLIVTTVLLGVSSNNVVSSFTSTYDSSNRTWLCPENEQRHPSLWELYDNATQKCFTPRTRGPCGTKYTIFEQSPWNSEYGKCRCSKILSRHTHLNRPLALSPDDGNCYPLYDKATCKDGEWLVLESNTSLQLPYEESYKGICQKNPCLSQQSNSQNDTVNTLVILKFLGYEYYKSREDFKCSDLTTPLGEIHPLDINEPFWFVYEDGKCYKTFSKGPCNEGELIVFEGTDINLKCYNPIVKLTRLLTSKPVEVNQQWTSESASRKSWLCPENKQPFIDETTWIFYDNATEKCYAPWKQGPCNGTFKYWSQSSKGSELGVCRNISPLNTFTKLNRPIAESVKDGEVYLVYSKGNCADGEWFVFNENFEGVCSKNPCLGNQEVNSQNVDVNTTQLIKYLGYFYDSYENFTKFEIEAFPQGHPLDIHKPFWFLKKGKCYKYFSRGPCDEGELVVFKGINPIPTCYDPNIIYRHFQPQSGFSGPVGAGGLSGTGDQKCSGNKHGDKCISKPKIDFS